MPIINISGGTEVGACFLTPYPGRADQGLLARRPSLGMDVDVFDADGNPVRGEVGELVCKQPWPGMTRGIWGDPERYIETYWSMYPGVWRHGDWALIDEDGDWFLLGRSDDTINVAGKRLGPAEVESAAVDHPVWPRPCNRRARRVKGEVAWVFCVAAAGFEPGPELAAEVRAHVGQCWARRLRRAASSSCRRCPRRARPRSFGGRCEPLRSASNRATSRHSKTLNHSI